MWSGQLVLLLLLSQFSTAQQLDRYEFTEQKMGTTFRLVFYALDQKSADQAAKATFSRIDELNDIFSDYKEDSEISRLSQSSGSGKYNPVSNEMWEVLKMSQEISQASQGAFDITAGPLTKLWRRAIRRQEFPEQAKIVAYSSKVGHDFIKFNTDEQSVLLVKEGMRLDAGGIAKGYAVDEAYRVLKDLGIDRALIDGGGDIFVGSPPPGEEGWEIMVTCQSGGKRKLTLSHQGVASSGDTYKYLEWEGQRYSHIVDPRTGLGVVDRNVFSVLASNCTLADAMASAVSVIGTKDQELMLANYPQVTIID